MKMYQVIMENSQVVPLIPLSDPPLNGLKIEQFDTEQEAVDFAKSVRNNWEHVYIRKTRSDKLVREFYGDDMYIGDKKTSLKENE